MDNDLIIFIRYSSYFPSQMKIDEELLFEEQLLGCSSIVKEYRVWTFEWDFVNILQSLQNMSVDCNAAKVRLNDYFYSRQDAFSNNWCTQ